MFDFNLWIEAVCDPRRIIHIMMSTVTFGITVALNILIWGSIVELIKLFFRR